MLSSEDHAALETWLVDNDYDVPPGASPIIEEYVDLDYLLGGAEAHPRRRRGRPRARGHLLLG